MRAIKGLALGTYYAKGASAAAQTPNSSAMRGLLYAVKDNRPKPNPPQSIAHHLHPAAGPVKIDRTNAIERRRDRQPLPRAHREVLRCRGLAHHIGPGPIV